MEIVTVNPIFNTLYQIHTNPNHPVNLYGDLDTIYNSFGLNFSDLDAGAIKLAQIEPIVTMGAQILGSIPKTPGTSLLMVISVFANAAYSIYPCSTTSEIRLEIDTLFYQGCKTENPEIHKIFNIGELEKMAAEALKANQRVIECENRLYL